MPSSLSLEELIALNRNRWTVPLLADLAAHKGARFVELVSRLGVPRDSLARTLEAARTAGWVIPNPGHGHPLRPEYVLTQAGDRIAACADSLLAVQLQIGVTPARLTRWGLPLIHAIDAGHQRFNALARMLAPASPRALSQGLRALTGQDLVRRDLIDGYPPASAYHLTSDGILLARAV
jgi:DNA-binding HxlR family transcriptional regulator